MISPNQSLIGKISVQILTPMYVTQNSNGFDDVTAAFEGCVEDTVNAVLVHSQSPRQVQAGNHHLVYFSWDVSMPLALIFVYVFRLDLQGMVSAVVVGYLSTGAALSHILLPTD